MDILSLLEGSHRKHVFDYFVCYFLSFFYQNRITQMICGVAVSQDLSVLIHAARYRHLHVLKSWELCRLRIISCYLRIPLQLSF